MPEDVNFYQNGALATARRRNPATFEARHAAYLPPALVKYAIWLVSAVATEERQKRQRDGFFATWTERRMQLQSLTKAPWNAHAIKAVHRRADFQELLKKLTSINAEAVRTALTVNGYRYAEIAANSADKLYDNEDYKSAGELAMKAIGQIIGKKDDTTAAATVAVVITTKQAAGIDMPVIEVESTPIE